MSHVIEVKVLYPWRDPKLRKEKFAILRGQVALSRRFKDEAPDVRRTGLMFGIWLNPYDNPGYAFARDEAERDYFARLTRLFRETFPNDDFTTQYDYVFERIFQSPVDVECPGADTVRVQIGAAYVTMRS